MNRREAGLPGYGNRAPAAPAAPKDRREAGEALAALEQVLRLSERIAALADAGDVGEALRLDDERRALLASTRAGLEPFTLETRGMLRRIAELNDRSIGRLEHRLRALGRDMDMLATGKRAVRAYGQNRP